MNSGSNKTLLENYKFKDIKVRIEGRNIEHHRLLNFQLHRFKSKKKG